MTELPPEPCTGLEARQKVFSMIFFVLVSIKEIVEQGRDFPWPRPRCVLDVTVIGSGVMDLSRPFLMVLLNRSFCDVTAVRSAGA